MNAAQVRAKARTAMERRAEAVEQEEIEGGEINLIPYLDIVTNLMLFVLATVSVLTIGQIDTSLPAAKAKTQTQVKNPDEKPEENLQITVAVTANNIEVGSLSGLEGSLTEPKKRIPRTGKIDDFLELNDTLYEIAKRRFHGQLRSHQSYELILIADPEVPYATIIRTMDACRQKLPKDLNALANVPAAVPPKFEERDGKPVPVENYDADKHPLFDLIRFSSGLEF